SYDDAKHYDHLNHVAIGQFYHVGVDHRDGAYFVYGGLQDNGSWGGPSRVRTGSGPTNDDWFRIGGGDGFRCLVDPNDPDQLYFQSQNGGIGRRHLASGERAGFRPRPARGSKEKYRFNWYAPYQLSHHNSRIYYVAGNYVWRSLDRGNKLKKVSPEITHTERGSATAFAESPANADLLYVGTDDGALWVSRDGGFTWTDLYAPPKPESDEPKMKKPAHVDASEESGNGGEGDDGADKPKADPEKAKEAKPTPAKPKAEAGDAAKADDEPEALPQRAQRMLERLLTMDVNGDGKLQKSELPTRLATLFDRADANKDGAVTRDELVVALRGGAMGRRPDRAPEAATPAAEKAPKPTPGGAPIYDAQPDRRYVSWIEPSRFKADRAYLVFDGHRSDDDRALLFVTEDAGRTWRSITADLPATAGTTRHLREDPKNENVLWLGTEMGAYISLDRGGHWHSLKTNLPTVAVHAFAFHPHSGEVVAGTHGRSLWVLDATPLRQMTAKAMEADVHLFSPNRAVTWRPLPSKGVAKTFRGQNPSMGAAIHYRLAKNAKAVSLKLTKQDGTLVRELEAKGDAGLHRVAWDLRAAPPPAREGQQRRWRRGRRVQPGTYHVVLEVDGKSFKQSIAVEIDPEHTNPSWIAYADQEEAEDAERAFRKWQKKYAPWDGDD
ncbi:MAG: hypothetical protein QNJ98_20235, partial [Planctomycetota bacterium]|nr:hypothetical protein [Planctomycetota bacterium]